ncbi:MAG TPA: hypothetical protein VFA34_04225 [Actinomycetota bacterium]|jgi:hypothetical protein|nr:hypothetical protein [Actinomycetota bacterium]
MRASKAATELAVAGLVLGILAAAAFGSHVANGGFVSDDWPLASTQALRGFGAGVQDMTIILGSRPLMAVFQPARFALLGTSSPVPHLVLALVLGALTALGAYALLRELRLRRVEAGCIAALGFLFPWADSIHLWANASLHEIALVFLFGGATLSLRSFRVARRRSTFYAAAGTAALVASVLTYEVVAAVALAVGALYLTRAPVKRALTRWAVDAVCIGGAAVYSIVASTKPPQDLSRQIDRAIDLAKSAVTLTATAVLPVRGYARLSVLIVFVVLGGALWYAARRTTDAPALEIRRLLVVAGIALAGVVASYAPFVPQAYWTAWKPGLENRVNILAAFPMAVFAYCVAALTGVLAGRIRPSTRWLPPAVTIALVLAIGASYLRTLSTDKAHWAEARTEADAVLNVLDSSVPSLPRDSTVYVFGARGQVAPGVHVFAAPWDLHGALTLNRADRTLAAYPVLEGGSLECGRTLITPHLTGPLGDFDLDPTEQSVPYGLAYFVDVPTGSAVRPLSRRECRQALRTLEPGQFRRRSTG